MSIEQNRKLASEFFARFTTGDLAGALELMADDATWWLAGKAGQLPLVGVQDKARMTRVFHGVVSQLKNGLTLTVKSSLCEGDKVALEVESYGELLNGRIYNQEYHFLMTVRDGKITAVKEYLDTQHTFAVWVRT